MIKAICYKDVRPGDVVGRSSRERITISAVVNGIELDYAGNDLIRLFIDGFEGMYLAGPPEQLIGLIHRPWPQGQTIFDLLNEIGRLGSGVQPLHHLGATSLEQAMTELREAIEVFELGFPPTDGE